MQVEMPSIIDPFHRDLYRVLMEEIQRRVERLAKGDVENLEDYRAQVSYIKCLNHVLDKCNDIERDRYGKLPGGDRE